MNKILVTGFPTFLNVELNPSEKLLGYFNSEKIDTLLLPVSFNEVREKISSIESSYDFIFLFGLNRGQSTIKIERIALNWKESSSPDNSGVIEKGSPIDYGEQLALYSSMDLDELGSQFTAKDLEFSYSCHAGTYVCNCTYYTFLKKFSPESKIVFIHLPENVTESMYQKLARLIESYL